MQLVIDVLKFENDTISIKLKKPRLHLDMSHMDYVRDGNIHGQLTLKRT